MPRYTPFPSMPRRPRRLTWYSVITQIFTLFGRLIGRAATGSGSTSTGTRKTAARRRAPTSTTRRSTCRR